MKKMMVLPTKTGFLKLIVFISFALGTLYLLAVVLQGVPSAEADIDQLIVNLEGEVKDADSATSFKEELREELKKELREELKKELREELKEKLREELIEELLEKLPEEELTQPISDMERDFIIAIFMVVTVGTFFLVAL